jgi:hypothetical protein
MSGWFLLATAECEGLGGLGFTFETRFGVALPHARMDGVRYCGAKSSVPVSSVVGSLHHWLARDGDTRYRNPQIGLNVSDDDAQQIVGRERRERVSHHDWSGNA